MAEIIITYETLFELLRREKTRKELQELNPDFFKNVLSYLKEKNKILESQKTKDSIFSKEAEKTTKQLQNTKKILRDLYERRENKILHLALSNSRLKEKTEPNMLPEEKQLHDHILDILNNSRKSILYSLLSNKLPEIKTITPKKQIKETIKLIRFTKPVPKFLAPDLSTYGPFEKEDILNIDSKIANVLITKKRAKEISL